jgi:hypothetical protein
MRRRQFIALLGGVAASLLLTVRAQQDNRVRRIGWLVGLAEQDPEAQDRNAVVVQGFEISVGLSVATSTSIIATRSETTDPSPRRLQN